MTYLLPTLLAGEVPDADTLSDPDNQVTSGTYTPTLTASGYVAGTGAFINGIWHRIGRLITGSIDFYSGTGATLAGTSWRLSLPFDADLSFHTAGVLNAASDIVGNFQTYSGTASDGRNGGALLSNTAELIFYPHGTTTSIGSVNFTTAARIKARFCYLADAAEF